MSSILKTKFLTLAGSLALACVLMSPAARADGLTVSLPTLSGNVGDMFTVVGTISNSTSNTYYFVNDTVTFNDLSLTGTAVLSVNAFLELGPASIGPSTSPSVPSVLTGVDLFTLTILAPETASSPAINSYNIFGSTDPTCESSSCSTLLATVDFTVNISSPIPEPEPGSLVLLASGLLVGLLALRRASH